MLSTPMNVENYHMSYIRQDVTDVQIMHSFDNCAFEDCDGPDKSDQSLRSPRPLRKSLVTKESIDLEQMS